MKKIIFVCLTLWLNAAVFAQVSYTLRIMDVYGKPMSNIEVTAINNDIGLTLKSKTDMNGCALFTLTKAGMYTFSYLEMKDVKSFEMPENVKGQSKSTVTYDPEKIFEWKPCNRSGIVFKSQTPLQLKGQTNIAKVTIEVLQNDNTIVPDVAVDIVDCKNKIKYAAKANSAGIAVFYVPVNQEYEVDIAGSEALRKLKLPNHSYMEYKETVFYEKTKVKGTIKGDTILQKQITQGEGTTTHLLFTFKLKDYNSNPLPDEPVYVCAENNKRVYEGLTDKNGACRFMLEKGNNYIINLKYEQGASFVEASNTKGFATAEETRTYRGSKNIEKMLAERHMNEKGFVVNHNETPIRPAPRPVNYLKKTAQGYDVDFAPSGPVGTPTVINNKLFTQQGFYSPNFYCLDATTGQYLWGVNWANRAPRRLFTTTVSCLSTLTLVRCMPWKLPQERCSGANGWQEPSIPRPQPTATAYMLCTITAEPTPKTKPNRLLWPASTCAAAK
ncbi:MAG: hypothetical protein PHR81_08900 [Bacteroidales bacterium]|nr:hypothetical protein [Bacteroidales bacterium]